MNDGTKRLVDGPRALIDDVFADPQRLNPGNIRIVKSIVTPVAPPADCGAAAPLNCDTAVFKFDRAEYDITANPNGTVTVTHVPARARFVHASEGTDTLRNIERLQFADGTIPVPAATPTVVVPNVVGLTEAAADAAIAAAGLLVGDVGEGNMKFANLRPIVAPLFAVAVCLALSLRTDAANNVRTFADQLVATAVSAPDAGAVIGGRIDIAIERWSTDAERESLLRKLGEKNPATLLEALGKVWQRAGVVQMPGAQGVGARARTRRLRNLKFAQEIETATGRQVILVPDQHLGVGELGRDFESRQPEFTLVDIRLGPDGKGVGKPAARVTFNRRTHMFEIENYASPPVRLRDVRSEH